MPHGKLAKLKDNWTQHMSIVNSMALSTLQWNLLKNFKTAPCKDHAINFADVWLCQYAKCLANVPELHMWSFTHTVSCCMGKIPNKLFFKTIADIWFERLVWKIWTLVPWRQGLRYPTRNECMGGFAQIWLEISNCPLNLHSNLFWCLMQDFLTLHKIIVYYPCNLCMIMSFVDVQVPFSMYNCYQANGWNHEYQNSTVEPSWGLHVISITIHTRQHRACANHYKVWPLMQPSCYLIHVIVLFFWQCMSYTCHSNSPL